MPSQVSASIGSVANFGDSITCGFYASPNDGTGPVYSTHGYAGLLDSAIGKPARNLCRAGDQAADMARLWVYPNATPMASANQLYTVMIGTNDANACGSSDGCLTNYTQTLAASLAWLGMPAEDKVLASAVVNRSGNWSSDLGFGLAATGSGASIAFTVQQAVAGRSLYLAYRVGDLPASAAGTAVVDVDGQQVASLNGNPSSGHVLLTQNGTLDSIFVVTLPLGQIGPHEVSIHATSQATASFTFLWAGVPSRDYSEVAGAPRIIIGGVPAAASSSLNDTIELYNDRLLDLVASLKSNGLNIAVASTATALDGIDDMADVLHPNTAGHIKLGEAFASVL